MRLRVICQICGNTAVLNTEKPSGPDPKWTAFPVSAYLSGVEADIWKDYDIWICPECMAKYGEWDVDYDEHGEPVGVVFDSEELRKAIRRSLLPETASPKAIYSFSGEGSPFLPGRRSGKEVKSDEFRDD